MEKKYNGKVELDLLFRSFNNTATAEEKAAIDLWLKDSPENMERYFNARALHEAMLLEAPLEVFEGKGSASGKEKKRLPRMILIGLGNAAAIALAFFIGKGLVEQRVEDRLASAMTAVTVPAGQRLDYALADGTVIKLNSGARLEYPAAFARDSRTVYLDGEAWFDVTHDEDRPFTVRTFASDITVLGTRFNIDADEEAGTFSASLIDGCISLSNSMRPEEKLIMKPGERVTLSSGKMVLEKRNTAKDARWTEGIMEIGGLDFTQLMKKLEKTFGVTIIMECDNIPEISYIGGEIRISDGIDNALKVIGNCAGFSYRKDSRTNTIYIQ